MTDTLIREKFLAWHQPSREKQKVDGSGRYIDDWTQALWTGWAGAWQAAMNTEKGASVLLATLGNEGDSGNKQNTVIAEASDTLIQKMLAIADYDNAESEGRSVPIEQIEEIIREHQASEITVIDQAMANAAEILANFKTEGNKLEEWQACYAKLFTQMAEMVATKRAQREIPVEFF